MSYATNLAHAAELLVTAKHLLEDLSTKVDDMNAAFDDDPTALDQSHITELRFIVHYLREANCERSE